MEDIYFEYEDKKYYIKIENPYIFCYVDDGHPRTNLTYSEKYIVKTVIKSLTPNVLMPNYYSKEKDYGLYYDASKKIYFTDSKDSSIIKNINHIFNHTPGEVCSDRLKNGYKDFITRFAKIENKLVKIFISSTLSLSLLAGCAKFNEEDIDSNDYLIINEPVIVQTSKEPIEPIFIVAEQEEQPYDFDDIKTAIEDNDNLTEDEKTFLQNFKILFDEFHKYIDINMCIDRLGTLQIEYIDEPSVGGESGVYKISENKIIIYKSANFNECDITTLIHEVLHVFEHSANNKLFELSNELLSREITRKFYEMDIIPAKRMPKGILEDIVVYGIGYSYNMPIMTTLAEMVSRESLIKFQFLCDTDILVQDLCTTEDGKSLPKDEAFEFVKNYAIAADAIKGEFFFGAPKELDEALTKCLDNLNYYYRLKYNEDLKSNLNIGINFYHNSSFNPYTLEERYVFEDIMVEQVEANPEVSVKNSKTMFGAYRYVTPRSYFFDDHPEASILFNSPTFVDISITPEIIQDFNARYTALINEEDPSKGI